MLWRLKRWILNFPVKCCRHTCIIVYQWRLSMLFVTNLTWNSFTSQNSETHALFMQWFRSDLQSGSIFQFSLHISVIECDLNVHFAVKTVFSLLPAIFFELPITWAPDHSNFFDFPWRFELLGVDFICQGKQ